MCFCVFLVGWFYTDVLVSSFRSLFCFLVRKGFKVPQIII